MTPNPFDQAARYTAKLDPPRFRAWLLRDPQAPPFRAWLDTRTIPFPGDPDRTGDLVAGLRGPGADEPWSALAIEFQTRPDPEMFGRLLEFLGRLWRERRPPEVPRERYQVFGAVINLTGSGQTSQDLRLAQTAVRTLLQVAERDLHGESAAATLQRIAAGEVGLCLLPFIPLMHGGADDGIIPEWQRLALSEPDARRRADYAGLALVFAELAGCWSIWKQRLEGWNVEVSQQVLEWQAVAEKRGRAQAKAEDILHILLKKFAPATPAEVERAIRGEANLDRLDQWLDDALSADSPEDFRRRAGL